MAVLAGAAAAAGIINSVAGGGTIVSFPVAVALGLPPIVANATNAVALSPASIASAFAYRRELDKDRAVLRLFLPPAAVGALLGAALLLWTPQRVFDAIIPVLVLFTTVLLLIQNLRPKRPAAQGAEWRVPQRPLVAILLQLAIGVYGGYFGGGMGIMMLALLDRMGGDDIHRMNGVKSVLGAAINGIAAVAFVIAGTVDARAAAIMTAGAVIGGFAGAAVARRVRPAVVRWVVVAIGFALTIALAYRRWT
jgi:uncharacterized membrane protein YfcA